MIRIEKDRATVKVRIIGAGLAGSEAAWQCARRGLEVELFEMRPARTTPAHQTADFAELVCSNSLKSDTEHTAPWLLKEEMRRSGSLLLEIAHECARRTRPRRRPRNLRRKSDAGNFQ
jgi:methylenetetrahydrofolate--tRNA-(uracil-5-)-methyltransferase